MSRGGTQTSQFGLRDLGMLFPDEVGATRGYGDRDETADALPAETLKPKFDPKKKVQRLRAGVRPHWAKPESSSSEEEEEEEEVRIVDSALFLCVLVF